MKKFIYQISMKYGMSLFSIDKEYHLNVNKI